MFNFYSSLGASIGKMLLISLLVSVVGLIARLMIMLTVSEDGKAIGVKNRTLWMVLSFFFPIAALIYLAVRSSLEKTVPRFCPRCGATSAPNAHLCQQCGNTALMDYQVTDAPVHQKKRKNYLTWGIVLFVVYYVVELIAVGTMISTMTKTVFDGYKSGGNGSGFYDFNPDYNDNFDDYFNDNFDDFFDEFNNFGNGN